MFSETRLNIGRGSWEALEVDGAGLSGYLKRLNELCKSIGNFFKARDNNNKTEQE